MKKIILVLLVMIFSYSVVGAETSIREGLLNQPNIIVSGVQSSGDGFGQLNGILKYIKESISSLLLVIVLAVFIFIGTRLFVARGNPEEFKKAMMHFVYTIVGIFVISVAYAVVTMVSGISI